MPDVVATLLAGAFLVGIFVVVFRGPRALLGPRLLVGPKGVRWLPVGVAASQILAVVAGLWGGGQAAVQVPWTGVLVLAALLAVAMRSSLTDVIVGALASLATLDLIRVTVGSAGVRILLLSVALLVFPLTIGVPVSLGLATIKGLVTRIGSGVFATPGSFLLACWGLLNVVLLMIDGHIFDVVAQDAPMFAVLFLLCALVGFGASVLPGLIAPILGAAIGLAQVFYATWLDPAVAWLDLSVFVVAMIAAMIGSRFGQ